MLTCVTGAGALWMCCWSACVPLDRVLAHTRVCPALAASLVDMLLVG